MVSSEGPKIEWSKRDSNGSDVCSECRMGIPRGNTVEERLVYMPGDCTGTLTQFCTSCVRASHEATYRQVLHNPDTPTHVKRYLKAYFYGEAGGRRETREAYNSLHGFGV